MHKHYKHYYPVRRQQSGETEYCFVVRSFVCVSAQLNANFLHIFSTYGRKCKQIAFLSLLPLLFIHKFR